MLMAFGSSIATPITIWCVMQPPANFQSFAACWDDHHLPSAPLLSHVAFYRCIVARIHLVDNIGFYYWISSHLVTKVIVNIVRQQLSKKAGRREIKDIFLGLQRRMTLPRADIFAIHTAIHAGIYNSFFSWVNTLS